MAAPFAAGAQQATEHAHHDHAAHGTPAAGAGEASWTKHPLLVRARGDRGDRTLLRLEARNFAPAAVTLLGPSPESLPEHVAVRDGRAEFRAPRGTGNYYWVSARAETAGEVRTAATVHYFSNPGPAPTDLLARPKGELELVPARLPREHAQYRAGEVWPFLVRFAGKPVEGAVVSLETEHGTMDAFRTDADGIAQVRFPRQMTSTTNGEASRAHHARPRTAFVLAVDHHAEGRRYASAFNYAYAPHAYEDKHLGAGIGFAVLGALFAAPLVRAARKRT